MIGLFYVVLTWALLPEIFEHLRPLVTFPLSLGQVITGIGIVIGTGHLFTAVKLSLLTVVLLVGVDYLEENIKSLGRGVHVKLAKYWKRNKQNKRDPP